MNSSKFWYYATEMVLGDEYFDWEFKSPGLGDLQIYRKPWTYDAQPVSVASFPKGMWEYARLLVNDENDEDSIVNSNNRAKKKLKNSKARCGRDHLVPTHELDKHNLEIHDLAECSDCDYECAGTLMLAYHFEMEH
jgi:hypothetical protein